MDDEFLVEINEHYERNFRMMKLWENAGFVIDQSIINVDFSFLISSEQVKNDFISKFKDSKVKISTKEYNLSSALEYYVTITLENDTWNIDKLNATTYYFFSFAKKVDESIKFEGVGAFIPKIKK